MTRGLTIAFFGSGLVSTYWNSVATYYRGIIRALHARGHHVTFYEPDVPDRRPYRDIFDPHWADIRLYATTNEDELYMALLESRNADVIIKASGVGVFDELVESLIVGMKKESTHIVFWDFDAPTTLNRLQRNPLNLFYSLIPHYDLIVTSGGGESVVQGYYALGARECVPIYAALDPDTHHPVSPDTRFEADLAFLGNRWTDRETRVDQFFFQPAASLPHYSFLLGGNGWENVPMPPNVRYPAHVYTYAHNAFYSTPHAILHISRASKAHSGFAPSTRIFEAAGAGACLISDAWPGLELFLEPGREVLVAHSGDEMIEHLQALTPERARAIGTAALRRVLNEHTYEHRVEQLETILDARCGRVREVGV